MNQSIVAEIHLLAAQNHTTIPVDEIDTVKFDDDAIVGNIIDDLLRENLPALRHDLGKSKSRTKRDTRIRAELDVEGDCRPQGGPYSRVEASPVARRLGVVNGTEKFRGVFHTSPRGYFYERPTLYIAFRPQSNTLKIDFFTPMWMRHVFRADTLTVWNFSKKLI